MRQIILWIQKHEILHGIVLYFILVSSVILYAVGRVSQLYITLVIVLFVADVVLKTWGDEIRKGRK